MSALALTRLSARKALARLAYPARRSTMVDDHVEIVTFSLPEAVRDLFPATTPTRADATRSWHLAPGTPLAVGHARLTLTFPSSFPPRFPVRVQHPPLRVAPGPSRGQLGRREVASRGARQGDEQGGPRRHQAGGPSLGRTVRGVPAPRDAPVSTVVEPVIDSSRYFVLRVEDEATRRHAFLGLGFRERDAASDFKLAVQEHQQQALREKKAALARAEYERTLAEKNARARGGGGGERGETSRFLTQGEHHHRRARAGRERRGRGTGRGDGGGARRVVGGDVHLAGNRAGVHRAARAATVGGERRRGCGGGAGGLGELDAPAEDDWADFQS